MCLNGTPFGSVKMQSDQLPQVTEFENLGSTLQSDGLLLISCPSHNFPHLRANAIARSVTVARSSAVQASSSRRQERRWAIVGGSPQSQSTYWASSR